MNLKNLFLIAFIGLFAVSCAQKSNVGKDVKLENQLDSASYALGQDVGNHLKSRNGVEELNYEAFMDGLYDVFNDKEQLIEESAAGPLIQKFLTEAKNKGKQENLEEGQAFLEKNKKKEGVKVTESGLQYKVLKEGSGISPDLIDTVKVHYVGTHLNGEEFDSSVKRGEPTRFPLNRVIQGWQEGLQLMKEGAKYKFFIPSDLAYGERVPPAGEIEPNETLIFEVELLEVKKAKEE